MNKKIKEIVKDERLENLSLNEIRNQLKDITLNELDEYMNIYENGLYLGKYDKQVVEQLIHDIDRNYIGLEGACELFETQLGEGAERIYLVWKLSNQLFATTSNPFLDIMLQDNILDYSNILSNLVISRIHNSASDLNDYTILEKRLLVRDAVNNILSNANLNKALKDALDSAFSSINI